MKKKLANEHLLNSSSLKNDEIIRKEPAKVFGETISRYFDYMQVENPLLREELKKRMIPIRTYNENYDEHGVYHGPSPTTAVEETSAQRNDD